MAQNLSFISIITEKKKLVATNHFVFPLLAQAAQLLYVYENIFSVLNWAFSFRF